MPVIQYPQLENELFCNIYYLRHLCDQQRFPDWPIKEPVGLELHTISSHQYMTSLSSLSLPSLPSFPPSLSPFPPSLSPFPLSLPFSPFPLFPTGQVAERRARGVEEGGGEETTRDVC